MSCTSYIPRYFLVELPRHEHARSTLTTAKAPSTSEIPAVRVQRFCLLSSAELQSRQVRRIGAGITTHQPTKFIFHFFGKFLPAQDAVRVLLTVALIRVHTEGVPTSCDSCQTGDARRIRPTLSQKYACFSSLPDLHTGFGFYGRAAFFESLLD